VVVPVKDDEKITGAIGIVDLTAGIFEEIQSIARRKEFARFLPDEAFPK